MIMQDLVYIIILLQVQNLRFFVKNLFFPTIILAYVRIFYYQNLHYFYPRILQTILAVLKRFHGETVIEKGPVSKHLLKKVERRSQVGRVKKHDRKWSHVETLIIITMIKKRM